MPNASSVLARPAVRRAVIAAVAVALLAYPWLAPNSYLKYAGALAIMYAALATSWNLVGGFIGYVSLGHAAFFGLGAYGTAIIVRDVGAPHLVALPLSVVGTMVFAAIVGVAAVQVRGASFVIVSIALVTMMSLLAQSWRNLTGGSAGLRVSPLSEELDRTGNHILFFNLFFVVLVLALFCWWFIDRSRFGAGLKAIREDEDKAESLGVPTTAYKVVILVLSAGFTAAAGGLYGIWFGNLDPIFIFSIILGANMVLMALFGGIHHLFGPVLGALIIAPASEYFLTNYGETQIHIVMSGVLLAVVVLFMPEGVIPAIRNVLRRFQPEAASIREMTEEEMQSQRSVAP